MDCGQSRFGILPFGDFDAALGLWVTFLVLATTGCLLLIAYCLLPFRGEVNSPLQHQIDLNEKAVEL